MYSLFFLAVFLLRFFFVPRYNLTLVEDFYVPSCSNGTTCVGGCRSSFPLMERVVRRLLARYIGRDYDGFVFTAAGTPDPALAFEYSLRQRKKTESSISEFRLEDIMRFPINKEKNGGLIVSEMSADDFLLKGDVGAGESQSEANQGGKQSKEINSQSEHSIHLRRLLTSSHQLHLGSQHLRESPEQHAPSPQGRLRLPV